MLKPEQVKVGAHVIVLDFDHIIAGNELDYSELLTMNNAYEIVKCHDDGKLFYILDNEGDHMAFIQREYKSFKLLEEPKHEETI